MPTPLLPVTLQPGDIRYAPGVRAGRWVFATGHKATQVLHAAAPRHGLPKHKREAQGIFANLDKVLAAGGAERRHVVRIDQYYTMARAVDPYHEVRREFFGGHIPPSTSNLHQRFLAPGQDIEVQLIAAVAEKGFEPVQHRPANLPVHASSGYSPVLTCGDFVFVAGQTSEALRTEEGPLDPTRVRTNFVLFRVDGDRRSFLTAAASRGLLLESYPHGQIRAATHHGISAADVDRAAAIIAAAIRESSPAAAGVGSGRR